MFNVMDSDCKVPSKNANTNGFDSGMHGRHVGWVSCITVFSLAKLLTIIVLLALALKIGSTLFSIVDIVGDSLGHTLTAMTGWLPFFAVKSVTERYTSNDSMPSFSFPHPGSPQDALQTTVMHGVLSAAQRYITSDPHVALKLGPLGACIVYIVRAVKSTSPAG